MTAISNERSFVNKADVMEPTPSGQALDIRTRLTVADLSTLADLGDGAQICDETAAIFDSLTDTNLNEDDLSDLFNVVVSFAKGRSERWALRPESKARNVGVRVLEQFAEWAVETGNTGTAATVASLFSASKKQSVALRGLRIRTKLQNSQNPLQTS